MHISGSSRSNLQTTCGYNNLLGPFRSPHDLRGAPRSSSLNAMVTAVPAPSCHQHVIVSESTLCLPPYQCYPQRYLRRPTVAAPHLRSGLCLSGMFRNVRFRDLGQTTPRLSAIDPNPVFSAAQSGTSWPCLNKYLLPKIIIGKGGWPMVCDTAQSFEVVRNNPYPCMVTIPSIHASPSLCLLVRHTMPSIPEPRPSGGRLGP